MSNKNNGGFKTEKQKLKLVLLLNNTECSIVVVCKVTGAAAKSYFC